MKIKMKMYVRLLFLKPKSRREPLKLCRGPRGASLLDTKLEAFCMISVNINGFIPSELIFRLTLGRVFSSYRQNFIAAEALTESVFRISK